MQYNEIYNKLNSTYQQNAKEQTFQMIKNYDPHELGN